eukprot:6826813-Alexandrium_andersonii.AAC.1
MRRTSLSSRRKRPSPSNRWGSRCLHAGPGPARWRARRSIRACQGRAPGVATRPQARATGAGAGHQGPPKLGCAAAAASPG